MKAFIMIIIFLSTILACGNRNRSGDYRFSSDRECRDFFNNVLSCLRSVNTSMSRRDIESELIDCLDQEQYNDTSYSGYNNVNNRNFNTNNNRRYSSSSTHFRTLQNQCYDENNINEWIRCLEDAADEDRDDCR